MTSRRAWRTVAGAFLIATGAGQAVALSLFYLPVTADYGFNMTSLSIYVSLMGLISIATNPIAGKLMLKWQNHIRLFAVATGALSMITYCWLANCRHLWQFYIGGVLLSVLVPFVSGIYGSVAITHWFVKKRSLALSISFIGVSVGSVLYAQIVRLMIDRMGWHAGYYTCGIMMTIFSLIAALLISEPPARYGLKPYGWEESEEDAPVKVGLTLQEARKTSCFWLFFAATFIASLFVMGLQQSIVPMLQVDYKMTAALSSTLMSLYSVTCAAAKILMGMLCEKRGIRTVIMTIGILLCAGIILIVMSNSLAVAVIAMVLVGLGNIFTTVVQTSYTADVFGNREYSAIIGYIGLAMAIGVAVIPVIIGRLYDLTGSYRPVYYLLLTFVIVATLLSLLSYRVRPRLDRPVQKASPGDLKEQGKNE